MEYKDTRAMAHAVRDELDKCISRSISRQKLTEDIKEILIHDKNKKKLFKAKGLSSTVETVLGKDRLSLFKEILQELGYGL